MSWRKIKSQRTKKNMVKDIIKSISKTWNKAMYILTIQTNIQLCSHTSTTWRPSSKLLVLNKSHLITNHYPEVEEAFFLCSYTLEQSILFQDLVDGLTMNGLEEWSGIMNILSLSTLDMLRFVTLLISLVLSLQSSTTSIQDTKPNNYAHNGLMFVRKNNFYIWDTPKNKWNM